MKDVACVVKKKKRKKKKKNESRKGIAISEAMPEAKHRWNDTGSDKWL